MVRPKFTARHFDLIADELGGSGMSDLDKLVVADFLSHIFEADNPNFKPELFFKRAGIEF